MTAQQLPVPITTPDRAAGQLVAARALIGNTPLLAIRCRFQGNPVTVYAKAENLNLTGSIKDRMALCILEGAIQRRELLPGQPIVEATSGNTGISLAALGRAMGHRVIIYMPDWLSEERKAIMRLLGAELVLVSAAEGGFMACLERAQAYVKEHGGFLANQFSNQDNVSAHREGTGREIVLQMQAAGVAVDAFVAGVGSGGTVTGVGQAIKEAFPRARIHPVEPASSPTLTVGHKIGKHRIQGISDDFVPEVVRLEQLDHILPVHDGDAILMAQKLASSLGLGVGISSGANFLAALIAGQRLGGDPCVVTVFADDNKKYLTTDLARAEPIREGYLSPEIELLGYSAMARQLDATLQPRLALVDDACREAWHRGFAG